MLQTISDFAASIARSVQGVGGFVAAAVGLGGTIFGWWQYARSRRRKAEKLKTLLAVGDRFVQTAEIEGDGYEKALEQYGKALALDKGNIDIYRRIFSATRRKLELLSDAALMNREVAAEIDRVLTRLYEFQASHEAAKRDKRLLLDEAALLWIADKHDSAFAVLKKAHEAFPEDAEVLASLGDMANDLDMMRRAVAAAPGEADYHRSLARILRKKGQPAEAIREYRRAAELATGVDIAARRTRNGALQDMLRVFKEHTELDMPLDERVQALEQIAASSASLDSAVPFYLATLYHARGELDKAHAAIRKALGDGKEGWRYKLPMLRLYADILEREGSDPATLAEVQAILQADKDRGRYEDALETYLDKGHRYKVGLRVENTAGDGLLVVRSYAGYPFAKAGVRDGDRILEFAHRKIRRLRDITTPLVGFTPGTDVPVKVQRAGELLDLTLIIQ